ncbi:YkgJ family cysteine cluster protein [Phenylobacterium sp.]|uniref:YkgJ family cysteine cluster protein n=1 Tax=Phenylobacterium sp. TaxID=1871053 RepID=UPI00273715F0|nr:YkgJ family cysteine cluster protein [Phenylobacterium sp.]MDP3855033.1 YkgJ family cysteine cluster protein [Phenylobacterium sp.]
MTGKSCGECGMCCKLLAIQTLDKAAGAWCGHFKRGTGCGIYADRPPACQGFTCLWLDSEKLDDAWRPDRAKFLMYTEKDGKRLNVIVDPAQPGAWKREPYYRRIKAMSQRALEGYELVVCIGDRRVVVFPHEDVDLGLVNPDHKLVCGYAERDGQMVPYAMILSDLPQAQANSIAASP